MACENKGSFECLGNFCALPTRSFFPFSASFLWISLPFLSFLIMAIKAFESIEKKTFPSCCYLLLALCLHLVVPIRGQGCVWQNKVQKQSNNDDQPLRGRELCTFCTSAEHLLLILVYIAIGKTKCFIVQRSHWVYSLLLMWWSLVCTNILPNLTRAQLFVTAKPCKPPGLPWASDLSCG